MIFCTAPQGVKMLIGGRGLGKSTIIAKIMDSLIREMPRSNNVIVGPTFRSMLENTLPGTLAGLELFGYVRNIHYVVNEKPPKGFLLPYEAPVDFKHYITFWNGTGFGLVSQDKNAGGGRGKNVDAVIADEAALLDIDQLENNVLLTNRGNMHRFGHSSMHHSVTFVTTHARTMSGRWIYDYEKLASENPKEYLFLEASSFHNAANLGKEYFKKSLDILGKHTYDIEIKNLRPRKVTNNFYPTLSAKKHYYTDYSQDYYNQLGYDIKQWKVDCRGDNDLNLTEELIISFDWGVFNSMVVMQVQGNSIRVLKEFFVEHPKIANHLVDDFLDYYEHHENKHIQLYYDRNANNRRPNSPQTLREEIQERIEQAGWTVENKVEGLDPAHADKYEVISIVLNEEDSRTYQVRINKHNCPNLIISMENAPTKESDQGVKKDKKSERNQSIQPQHATHLSDAFDIPIYNINKPLLGKVQGFVPVITT